MKLPARVKPSAVGRSAGAPTVRVVRAVAVDAEPALALHGEVEHVARGLQRAAAHEVVDRAELHAEADLGRVAAAAADARRRRAGLQLGRAGR